VGSILTCSWGLYLCAFPISTMVALHPKPSSSCDRDSVSPSIAHFVAQYGPSPGTPMIPADISQFIGDILVLVRLIYRAESRPRNIGSVMRITLNVPYTFVSN
jgi:hypothetical protein